MFKDYYHILDIKINASQDEIKKAFKVQALRWHPDKNKGKDTTREMQDINEAFLILKDTEARIRYDLEYKMFRSFKTSATTSVSDNQDNAEHEYQIKDEVLKKWMSNAKMQAVNLAIQTIKDFKGVSIEASKGCLEGLKTSLIFIVVGNLLFLLFKACN